MTEMRTDDPDEIEALIERLGRILSAGGWGGGLNPAQRAALTALSRANRFSRTPSAIADFLAATRGTVSQTLQSLEAKGLVIRGPGTDGRSVRYDLSDSGHAALAGSGAIAEGAARLAPAERAALGERLRGLLAAVLRAQGGRSFGVCSSCRHFQSGGASGDPAGPHRCGLLGVPLSDADSSLICAEHAA